MGLWMGYAYICNGVLVMYESMLMREPMSRGSRIQSSGFSADTQGHNFIKSFVLALVAIASYSLDVIPYYTSYGRGYGYEGFDYDAQN
ncbi:hypothetical protein CDAR_94281 [Caerostris darwini]|uniref:Uncharacterized protein n=1 Tax=Caerostris darwini TaxID=1538125 RepID=A0AAV4VP12_9ARAC|nr:hypothetical protein CDAR_94281 [Caerostris darwini]